MKLLSNLNKNALSGKICIVRAGLDLKNPRETFRLQHTLPTIKLLIKSKAKIVLIGHRNRPKKRDKAHSLKIVIPFFEKNLKKKITFLDNVDLIKVKNKIKNSELNSIFLLENLRYLKGETTNSAALGKQLASLGNIFINNDFSTSHRNHASITQITKYLPSFAGLLLENEIKTIDKIIRSTKKPLVVIVGGAKAPEKIAVIENLKNKADLFLVGGVIANTFLKARGFDIKKSIYDPKMIQISKKLQSNKKIILPIDFISHKNRFMDLGPLSIQDFKEKIEMAKTIFWNGPLGWFEHERFNKATTEIAKAVAKSKAFSVIGGAETVHIVNRLGLNRKIDFLSTGGGALLNYLGGKKLPGIEALKKTKKI